jgi:hypothetical protein
VRAEEQLRAAGVRPERLRERVDAAAAAIILQDYLDQRNRKPSGPGQQTEHIEHAVRADQADTDTASAADASWETRA